MQRKQQTKKPTVNKSNKPKRKGGSEIPDAGEIRDTNYLTFTKPFEGYGYRNDYKYIETSHFAGGATKLLKKSYQDYRKGKKSRLRGGEVADDTKGLSIPLKDVYNTTGLNNERPFQFQNIVKIFRTPFSSLGLS